MNNSFSRRSILSGIAVIAVFALSGSQCAEVGDRITAPTSGNGGGAAGAEGSLGSVAACVQACNEAARAAREEEQDRHKEDILECKDLSGTDRGDCLSEAAARHGARMEEISMEMAACKAPCHEQGGGSGGQ